MRVGFALVLSILVVNGLLLWWSWDIPEGNDLERLIPQATLALAVVDDPEQNLELLFRNPLQDWLELSEPDRLEPVRTDLRTRLEGLLTIPLRRAVLLLHQLEHRQESTFKIHFSLVFLPTARLERKQVDDQVEKVVSRLFGSGDFEVERRGQERLYRGRDPRQVLYYRTFGDLHAVSNSRPGWEDMARTWNFQQESLFAGQDYLEIRDRLPFRPGVLLYCDGSRILSPLPKFGYRIWKESGEIRDAFYAIGR